jgi:hypothetical protein
MRNILHSYTEILYRWLANDVHSQSRLFVLVGAQQTPAQARSQRIVSQLEPNTHLSRCNIKTTLLLVCRCQNGGEGP